MMKIKQNEGVTIPSNSAEFGSHRMRKQIGINNTILPIECNHSRTCMASIA